MVLPLRASLSLDEYLAMSFEQECELVEGELKPKPMRTFEHSDIQGELFLMLRKLFRRDQVRVELSIRHGEDVLIPDICVLREGTPRLYRRVLDQAPLLCVEIVSPSQRVGELLAKCEMYHEWGVEFCWVIDPVAKRAWNYHVGASPTEAETALTGPATIALATLFADER